MELIDRIALIKKLNDYEIPVNADINEVIMKMPCVPVALEPCPFCGGYAYVNREYNLYNVYCDDCGASSPVCDDEFKAVAAWNVRTK